jgi:NAD(P)-dependent dehydrogenase (short-subunit alcohol dehydrogenase family)
MPATSPIALILGAGSNVGHHVAQAFAAKGYKIALAARSLKEEESTPEQLNITSDFSDPQSVVKAFATVEAKLGIPSVVVYNGMGPTSRSEKLLLTSLIASLAKFNKPEDPFDIPLEYFQRDLNINTVSVYVAAQQAVAAFERLPDSASRTFIFTGNATNEITIAPLLTSGVGKSATAHIMHSASKAYKDKGYKCVPIFLVVE